MSIMCFDYSAVTGRALAGTLQQSQYIVSGKEKKPTNQPQTLW